MEKSLSGSCCYIWSVTYWLMQKNSGLITKIEIVSLFFDQAWVLKKNISFVWMLVNSTQGDPFIVPANLFLVPYYQQ